MKYIKRFFSISLGSEAEFRPLILSVLFTSIISATILAVMDINRPFMVWLIIALGISIVLTFLGFTNIGSWASLFASFLTLSILIFKNYGIRDTAVMGLIVILLGAGLLAGKVGTLIIGVLIILELGIYGALETKGIIVNQFSAKNHFEDYLVLCLITAMITALQWLVISRLNNTIVKAQKEGQAALERARGETAALRSLANAAKMLETMADRRSFLLRRHRRFPCYIHAME